MNRNCEIPIEKRRAWARIDLDAATHNFMAVKRQTEAKLCCVIKADAYGHGDRRLAALYESLGADFLAVSNIEEALGIRQAGIALPILILGYTDPECAPLLAHNHLTQCVFSREYGERLARFAAEAGVRVGIHIKIDTGMGRIGFLCRESGQDELEAAASVCRETSLIPEGIFTHFAVSDEGASGEDYTRSQFACFMRAIERLEEKGITFALRHCANSAAIFDYPEYHLDMVRAGLVLYGLAPSEKVKGLPSLIPVMSLHSVIAHIKTLEKGQTVSYGRRYTADRERRIATLPIGYADGFARGCGEERYRLLVGEHLCPIVGRVCMDQLMIDVSDVECSVGDEVTVFGSLEPCSADSLARAGGTIGYEIVCDIGKRIPRAFVERGRIIDWKDNILENRTLG